MNQSYNVKGWLSASDLHTWVSKQLHYLSKATLEDFTSMIIPFANDLGELRYE